MLRMAEKKNTPCLRDGSLILEQNPRIRSYLCSVGSIMQWLAYLPRPFPYIMTSCTAPVLTANCLECPKQPPWPGCQSGWWPWTSQALALTSVGTTPNREAVLGALSEHVCPGDAMTSLAPQHPQCCGKAPGGDVPTRTAGAWRASRADGPADMYSLSDTGWWPAATFGGGAHWQLHVQGCDRSSTLTGPGPSSRLPRGSGPGLAGSAADPLPV